MTTKTRTKPKTRDYSEDYALIERAQAGDNAARDQLIAKHMGFIYDMVRWLTPSDMDYEEFVADGVLVFMKCIAHFHLDSGNSILTLAHITFRRDICRIADRARLISIPSGAKLTTTRQAAAERARGVRFAGERSWMLDGKLDGADHVENELVRRAQACVRELPELHRIVLEERIKGRKLHEIGEDLGLSRERIRQLEEEAKEKCREMLEPMVGAA
mgnify:FL=1